MRNAIKWSSAFIVASLACSAATKETGGATEPTDLVAVPGEAGSTSGEELKELGSSGWMPPADAARISIDIEGFYPESIARAEDGTVFVSSLATGAIARVSPGSNSVEPFVASGVIDGSALGLAVDVGRGRLWACGADFMAQKLSALHAFDLTSGELLQKVPLPDVSFCNDLTLVEDGTMYLTDSFGGRILRLAQDGASLEEWLAVESWRPNPQVFPLSLNGIAWDSSSRSLYVGRVDTGALHRISVGEDGAPGEVAEVLPADGVGIDGLRVKGPAELLAAKGSTVSRIVDGEERAIVTVLADGLRSPTSVLVDGEGGIWALESQMAALLDGDDSTHAELPFQVLELGI